MTTDVHALVLRASDPGVVADFWGGLLGWSVAADRRPRSRPGVVVVPADDTGFVLRVERAPVSKTAPNRVHLDLTSTSAADQRARVERVLALGGRHCDVGQRGDEGHVVLADPEGNELCVIEPGNRFLADCGLVGALACDGSRARGLFWSAALGWPLVWDQGEETAVRSPHGGPKVTWGGPPVAPWVGPERYHLDLLADGATTQAEEVRRLLALGATPLDVEPCESGAVVLADPDGVELCVLAG